MKKNIILWHRRDLRIHDNAALHAAAQNKDNIMIPVVVLDPHFFEHPNYGKRRLAYYLDSIEVLAQQYQKKGTQLVLLEGEPLQVLRQLSQKLDAELFFNQDTNSRYGIERDRQSMNIPRFRAFTNDAIQRNGRDKKWHIDTANYFLKTAFPEPIMLPANDQQSTTSLDTFRKKYQILSYLEYSKTADLYDPGVGELAAQARLFEFGKILKEYPKAISSPSRAERGTSRLSAFLSVGSISTRTIYQHINSFNLKQKHFYLTRLFWNQHFTQKLNDNPTLEEVAANPVMARAYSELYQYDEKRIYAWKNGQTGYPLIDASMRALTQTGFLNFRMRAMVASFFCYILKQNWKIGADFMFEQLIDADKAINYSQWQMQAGMVGVHPNRIYNPTKQILDNDPDGSFIRRYVPELAAAPIEQLTANPEDSQLFLFGNDYYPPIVSYVDEMRSARLLYKKYTPSAYYAIKKSPELRDKLSLSGQENRVDRNEIPDTKEV